MISRELLTLNSGLWSANCRTMEETKLSGAFSTWCHRHNCLISSITRLHVGQVADRAELLWREV